MNSTHIRSHGNPVGGDDDVISLPAPSSPSEVTGGSEVSAAVECDQQRQSVMTSPASHVTPSSLHLTQEEQQRQLQALHDKVVCARGVSSRAYVPSYLIPLLQVECLLRTQISPHLAPAVTIPSPVTADAATNTGASLCWPQLSFTPSGSASEISIDLGLANDLSHLTTSTSTLSHDPANSNLDLQSYGTVVVCTLNVSYR